MSFIHFRIRATNCITTPITSTAPRRQFWTIRSKMGNAKSSAELVQQLKESGEIESSIVEHAMLAVDRKSFLPENTSVEKAYADTPQPIGHRQTISAPHMHAMTLELLKDYAKPGNRLLDVGSGSGIMCAYLAEMMDHQIQQQQQEQEQEQQQAEVGTVYGIEYVKELVDLSHRNLDRDPVSKELVERNVIIVQGGDGWKGLPEKAPFHAIHVGAAAAKIPDALLDQLAPGGRMVIPVGPQYSTQTLYCVDKDETGKIHKRSLASVGFVPLVQDKQ